MKDFKFNDFVKITDESIFKGQKGYIVERKSSPSDYTFKVFDYTYVIEIKSCYSIIHKVEVPEDYIKLIKRYE